MSMRGSCLIVYLSDYAWNVIFDELYDAALQNLSPFGHDSDGLPGYYHFVALYDVAQTCRAIRAHCLRRLYSCVRLSLTQTIFTIAEAMPVLYYTQRERGTLLQETPQAEIKTFGNTVSLELHASPLVLLPEHFTAISSAMPSLRHLYVHILFRPAEGTVVSNYRQVFKDINAFLGSAQGQNLCTFGFWFSRSDFDRPARDALLQDVQKWEPLLLGPSVTKVQFFADLCGQWLPSDPTPRSGILRYTGSPTMPLRLLPWPCHVRELAIEASDFCVADPINWLSQRGLKHVRIAQVLRSAYYSDDAVLINQLARALHDAAPAWAQWLTTLQLVKTHFDHTIALAIAELRGLTVLDIHPASIDARGADALVELDPHNSNLRLAHDRLHAHAQSTAAGAAPPHRVVLLSDCPGHAQSTEFDHLMDMPSNEFMSLLRLCIPSLPLRVIHLGSTFSCGLEPRELFLDITGFHSRIAVMCPSLRFVHCGPHGIIYGCHAHIAVNCSCSTNPVDLTPFLDPSCRAMIEMTCGLGSMAV